MKFNDFLKWVTVVKMLYGRSVAERVYLDNIDKFNSIIDNGISVSLASEKRKDSI